MSNAYWEALDFELPAAPETAVSGWRRWIDTALEAPEDIVDPPAAPPVPGTQYRVMPRSVAALLVRIERLRRAGMRGRIRRRNEFRDR